MIKTPRLILRKFILEDVHKVYQMCLEDGMKEFIPDQVYENEKEAKQVIAYLMSQYSEKPSPDKAPFVLGIELKETTELIGHVGLSAIKDGIEIGYAIEDKYQSKGYASEAVKALSDWALKEIKLGSIWGIVDVNNIGSIKVLAKAGYIFKEKNVNKLIFKYPGE